jgi:hypothetical protein
MNFDLKELTACTSLAFPIPALLILLIFNCFLIFHEFFPAYFFELKSFSLQFDFFESTNCFLAGLKFNLQHFDY